MKKEMIRGLMLTALGIFFIYWAQTHSPNSGFVKVLKNEFSGSYTLSEPWYYLCMVLGIITAVLGLSKVYKTLK